MNRRAIDDEHDDEHDSNKGVERRRTSGPPLSPRARRFVQHIADDWAERYRLTGAEREVFEGALFGVDRAALATQRAIASETLRRHVKHLLSKTSDKSLNRAVARALREAVERLAEGE